MMKINLLKNRGGSTKTSTTTGEVKFDTTYEQSVVDTSGSNTGGALIIKILILLSGAGGLMAYESYNVGQIQARVTDITNKKNKLSKEISDKKNIAEKAKELQKKIIDIETRIKAIKDLSKFRLREIKAIDYIQNNIPEKVWITSLDFKEDRVNIDGGTLSDDELNKFLEVLEGRASFKNVILIKAVEEKRKEGTVKYFQISSNLVSAE